MNDNELLRDYAVSRSEQVFATLVTRHVALVYSSALRQVRDPQLAEEVTQTVFIRLAQKVRRLRQGVILAGWLFRTTRFVASETLRMENRRRLRQQKAMETLYESPGAAPWEQIAPLLDEAMAGLSQTDRNAVLLRFFEKKTLKEVGQSLGINEDAAQKRVTRALEKLRTFFARRGTLISASVLTGALTTSAVQAVPTGLVASVTTTVALSGAAAGSTLALGALKFMAWTNLKSAVAVGVCAVTAATTIIVESKQVSNLRAENERLVAEIGQVQKSREAGAERVQTANDELERLRREAAEVYKLRGEVAQLRRIGDDATRLRAQLEALQTKLKLATAPKENDAPRLTAEQEQEQQNGIAKLNYLKRWSLAFHLYAEAHEGRMPKNFDEAQEYLAGDTDSAMDLGQFEIVYHGSLRELLEGAQTYAPSHVIVAREKLPTQRANGNWVRAYAFADGHSEIHSAPTEDGFANWEKERMVRDASAQ